MMHAAGDVWPVSGCAEPAAHMLHVAEPAADHVPAPHAAHEAADVWPVAEENVPAGQLVHVLGVVAPMAALHEPAAHGEKMPAPLGQKPPALHCVHARLPGDAV